MQTRSVYLDHNACASPTVLQQLMADLASGAWIRKDALHFVIRGLGNPSSVHNFGRNSKSILRELLEEFSKKLDCPPGRFFFTSGGSEGNSWVLQNFYNNTNGTGVVLTSRAEHDSVMLALKGHEKNVRFIALQRSGQWDLSDLKKAVFDLREKNQKLPLLISMVFAHHETGTLQAIEEVSAFAHQHNILIHLDAVQAFAKVPIRLKEWGVHFSTFSFQKLVGPVGLGALYVNLPADHLGAKSFSSLIFGHQQDKFRGGTENVLAVALTLEMLSRLNAKADWRQVRELRQNLERLMLKEFPGLLIAGLELPESQRLPNTTCFVLPQLRGSTAVMALDLRGICVSAGSACSSGNVEKNETLLAMGYSEDQAKNTLRLSLGPGTTEDELQYFISQFKEVVG